MIPQPAHKRTRGVILYYITLGSLFLIICISIIGIFHLKSTENKSPNKELPHNETFHTLESQKYSYKEHLTDSETQMIVQLRNETEVYFTKPYMRTDSYLVKWLRECDWNFEEARDMLLEHFEWRQLNNIDNILEEDFSYWEEEFPYYTDAVDFHGRPVAEIDFSLWDVRKVITAGKSDELLRYGRYQIEKGIQKIFKAQQEGKNVTQGIILANLDQFNVPQHACFKCIPVIVETLFDTADHYPGWLYRIILINTPEVFELILSLAAPASRGDNKAAIMIFGANKNEWEDAVFSLIPRDQLRPRFGGTKVANGDE